MGSKIYFIFQHTAHVTNLKNIEYNFFIILGPGDAYVIIIVDNGFSSFWCHTIILTYADPSLIRSDKDKDINEDNAQWEFSHVCPEKYDLIGLILGLHPANARWRYLVTSLIGWAQA